MTDDFLVLVLQGYCAVLKGPGDSHRFPVAMARGKHLFPFRTEQLSPSAPMVLGPQGPGRVGRRRFLQHKRTVPRGGPFVVVARRRRGGRSRVADRTPRSVAERPRWVVAPRVRSIGARRCERCGCARGPGLHGGSRGGHGRLGPETPCVRRRLECACPRLSAGGAARRDQRAHDGSRGVPGSTPSERAGSTAPT